MTNEYYSKDFYWERATLAKFPFGLAVEFLDNLSVALLLLFYACFFSHFIAFYQPYYHLNNYGAFFFKFQLLLLSKLIGDGRRNTFVLSQQEKD